MADPLKAVDVSTNGMAPLFVCTRCGEEREVGMYVAAHDSLPEETVCRACTLEEKIVRMGYQLSDLMSRREVLDG